MNTDKKFFVIIKSDGSMVHGVSLSDSKYVPLEFMQKMVDGSIEHIYTPGSGDVDYWADEEGKLKGKPLSPIGSGMVSAYFGFDYPDCIAGDILILAHEGEETRWLNEREMKEITALYALISAHFNEWLKSKNK